MICDCMDDVDQIQPFVFLQVYDLYIIGAVCVSVGHKSDYFQAECVKVSRNRRNHKKCLEMGENVFSHFLTHLGLEMRENLVSDF